METLIIDNPALPNPTLGATECRSATGATPAQVQQAALDAFSQLLTTAHPTQQPGGGSLVNLPTLFATNTPQTQTFNETLLSMQVTLNVQASWTWDFGDGTTLVSTIPGGQYPDTSLSHIYLAAGQYTIQLTTNWTGTFSMAGGAAAVIPGGPIPRVSAPFVLPVHEARGVLVTG
jgi:PKD domain